jgi:nitrite reductase (NADH) large subunit
MARERLLVVGNGMAAVRLLEGLAARCPGAYDVTVVGAEPRPGYNRVLLSSLLAAEIEEGDIALREVGWYAAQGFRLLTGRTVAAIDAEARTASLDDGAVLPFDRLVLATGSQAIRLPKPGMDLPGALTFRDLSDISAMRDLRPGAPAVVIGGGLLVLEAAYGLARAGARVTVIHLMDRLMERQLDGRGALYLKRAIERRGIRVLLGADTARVVGEDRAQGVELSDGAVIPAELVVSAVGIRPNAALAGAAGLAVRHGVLVDNGMETDRPGIYAIGECAEHRGVVYGLVEPAYEQADALAARLAGKSAAFAGRALATNLKISGVPVFSAGEISGGPGCSEPTLEDRGLGLYRKLVLRDGRLVGCVLVGEAADGLWYRDLIRTEAEVSAMRADLIFGRAFAEAPEPAADASAMREAA